MDPRRRHPGRVGDLTEGQIDKFVDVMISKLATMAAIYKDEPEGWTGRDEVRMTIVDAGILFTSDDPPTMLESWLEDA